MSWPSNTPCPKCDECGKFIPLADLTSGVATHKQVRPDSDYSTETDESLCRKCKPAGLEV